MDFREQFWTILFALLVSVLIWLWAEGENREKQSVTMEVSFSVPTADRRYFVRAINPLDGVSPVREVDVQLELEGPNLALQRVLNRLDRIRLAIDDPGSARKRTLPLASEIEALPLLTDNGVTVAAVEPEEITLQIDEIVTKPVKISNLVPGIDFEHIRITPDTVDVAMSEAAWNSFVLPEFGAEFVFLDLPDARWRALNQGEDHVLNDVPLRIHERVAALDTLVFDPPPVRVELRLRRRLIEKAFPVPVKFGIPAGDGAQYLVTVDEEDELLQNVLIAGDDMLIRQLENREIAVYAMLNLSSEDLERRITSKRVEWNLPPGLTARMANGDIPEIEIHIEIRRPEDT